MARRYGTGRRRRRRRRHVSHGRIGPCVVIRQHSRDEHRDNANYYPSSGPDGTGVVRWGTHRMFGD
jgi:hypothetical protein